ncbi:MAG: STAS domain-containing protein [Tissierellia bacterium]|nr:STAS domain-containing protein [Tissierellia bacterium]
MSFQLSRNYDKEKDLLILKPIGELDIYSSPEFKKIGEKEYQKYETNILIDGSDLKYMDSTGLGAFIYLLNICKEKNHKIRIQGLSPNIRKLFTITKMDELFIFEGDKNA